VTRVTLADINDAMPSRRLTSLPKPSVKINKFPPKLDDHVSRLPTLAVCVKPLHFNLSKTTWFVEFVEMYRLQGASHFFFYDHSVSQGVVKVLSHYVRKKLVTVLPWNLPLPSQKMIREPVL
jgi:hypothetical protein